MMQGRVSKVTFVSELVQGAKITCCIEQAAPATLMVSDGASFKRHGEYNAPAKNSRDLLRRVESRAP
jgi:hypothetical protein